MKNVELNSMSSGLGPQLDRNRDLQQPLDTFKSHKNRYNQDMEAYASNRRYFD